MEIHQHLGRKGNPAMNGLDSKHTVDGCDMKKITSWFFWCIGVSHYNPIVYSGS